MTNGINQLIAQGRPAPQWDWMEAKKNALALSQAEREYAGYPEERNWLREKRGMERTRFGQEQEELPFKKEEEALDFLSKWGRLVNYRNYPDTRMRLIKRGVNPSILPPVESFGGDENKFNEWLNKSLTTLEQRLKEREVGVKERAVGVEEKKLTMPEKEKEGEFERLVNAYNKMLPNDPNKTLYLARIKKMSETTGFRINVDKDGNIEIVQGPMGEAGFTKATQTRIQEKLFNAKEQLSRVKSIEDMFKPEYQNIATRGGAWWSGVKAKLGADLSKEETKNLTNFAAYKRTSIANINLYIKEITGAQMSEAEADRLRLAMPDPGEGIFGGDDPVSFKAKLDDVTKEIKASVHRYEKLLKNGFTPEEINKMAKTDSLPNLNKYYSIETPKAKKEIKLKSGKIIEVEED